MNIIFSDLLDICVVIYLDDIHIYTKVEKCKFYFKLVKYLGHILSPSKLTISDNKVKDILDWPELKKVKDIQSFLGFTNFYY